MPKVVALSQPKRIEHFFVRVVDEKLDLQMDRRAARVDAVLTPDAVASEHGGLGAAVSVVLSDEERDAGRLRRETVDRAVNILDRAGVVVLHNALQPQLVAQAHSELCAKWDNLHAGYVLPYEQAYADVDGVGTRRFRECVSRGEGRYDMSLAEHEGEEDSEDAPASAALSSSGVAGAVVRACLGRRAIPFGNGVVVSLSGSADQPKHVDSPHLFDPRATGAEPPTGPGAHGDAGLAFVRGALPAHHLTVFTPLVDLTEATGCTRFVPGSHLTHTGGWRGPPPPAEELYEQLFPVRGCVVIFDCRVYHQGTGNTSGALRPIHYRVRLSHCPL
jgi:ectoine hydroxylase-related dioxygenase (phytanoyl-CoA dioxygenase family)